MKKTSRSSLIIEEKGIHLGWSAWLLASRPKTLLVSLPPIFVGTTLAWTQVQHLNWILVFFALLCSLGIHIGTNFTNDAFDFKKGADGPDRLGPVRMTQLGAFSFQELMKGAYLCFGVALLCGIPLMVSGGWPLFAILLISAMSGYCYTAGPFPLAYYPAISDLFVLIFFGWVSTNTVYYLLAGSVNLTSFLASTQIGLLAVVPLAINNLRDHVSDARVNKNTFVVCFGPHAARWEITLLSLLPFVLGGIWLKEGQLGMALLPLLALPMVIKNLRSIWQTEPSSEYNRYLAKSAQSQLLFGLLLSIGILVG